MIAITLLDKLRKFPVFGTEEIVKILHCKKKYANLVLLRLEKKKAIKRIDIGKYTLCNFAQTIATHLVKPSYITGWYALKIYGLTEQLPQQIDVFTIKHKNNKIIEFVNEKIKYTTVHKKYLFEYFPEVSEQYTMNIASLEKTIIDCIYFGLVPLSVILYAIKASKNKISIERIKKISLKLKNKQFLKKVGIIFDSIYYDLSQDFKRHIDYNPVILDKHLCKLLNNSKFKKWGIKCR